MAFPFAAIAVAVFINALWGGNPIAVKIGLEAFPPFSSAFIRFAIAVVVIGAWAVATRRRLRPPKHEWPALALLSVMFGVQILVMNAGVDISTGANAAVLISTFPLIAAVLAHFFIDGERLTGLKIAGLLAAFLGVGLIISDGGSGLDFLGAGLGDLLTLCSAALLGARLVFSANLLLRIETARVVFWQMMLALPVFLAGAVATETPAWDRVDLDVVLALLFQGVVIAGFGFVVNALLLKRYSPTLVVSFGFVSPVSGVLLAVWLLGETLTLWLVIGTIAVGIGLVLISRHAGLERPDPR